MGGSAKRYGMESTRKGGPDLEVRLRGLETAIANYTPTNQDVDLWSAARTDAVPRITGIKLTGQGPGFVSVGWDATTISDLVRYEIVFAENYNFADEVQSFDTVTNTYLFGTGNFFGAASGTVYYCKVRAENSIGTLGPWSEILNTTTGLLVRGDIEEGGVFPDNLFEDSVASLSIDELLFALIKLEGLRGPISGLTLSRVSGGRINVGRGSTSRLWDQLGPGGMTKSSATWQPGHDVGGMAEGVDLTPNTWYDVFLIMRDNDGFIDVGFDTNPEAFNLILDSGYDRYRLVGSVLTDGAGAFIDFTQVKEVFTWKTLIDEGAALPSPAEMKEVPLTTPPHMVKAIINVDYAVNENRDDQMIGLSLGSTVLPPIPDITDINAWFLNGAVGNVSTHSSGKAGRYKILVGADGVLTERSSHFFDDYEIGSVGYEHIGLHSPTVKETVDLDLPNNFAPPAAGSYYAKSIKDDDFCNASFPLLPQVKQWHFENGDGETLLVKLDEDYSGSEGFFVFFQVIPSITAGASAAWTLREGSGASVTSPTAAENVPRSMKPQWYSTVSALDAEKTVGAAFSPESPPLLGVWPLLDPVKAEWGLYQASYEGGALGWGGTLLVFPHDNDLITHAGPNLGMNQSEWFISITEGEVGYPPTEPHQIFIGNDIDQTFVADTVNIEHGQEDYLIFAMCQLNTNAHNGTERSLRWYWTLDGVDLFNVKTGETTAGSTRCGRGFQLLLKSFPSETFYCPFVVKKLSSVPHVPGLFINKFEDPARAETMDMAQMYFQRTSMLSKFTYMTNSEAVVVSDAPDPGVKYQESEFFVEIESDGTPIVIGFSTTVHMHDYGTAFAIVRNDGTSITPILGGVTGTMEISRMNNPAGGDGTDGAGDTDNATVPFSVVYVDENPPSGHLVYAIQYDRDFRGEPGDSSMFNTRDDGSDGFQGTMFAFELKFATSNY